MRLTVGRGPGTGLDEAIPVQLSSSSISEQGLKVADRREHQVSVTTIASARPSISAFGDEVDGESDGVALRTITAQPEREDVEHSVRRAGAEAEHREHDERDRSRRRIRRA